MRKSVVLIGLLVCLYCQIALSSISNPTNQSEPPLLLELTRENEIHRGAVPFSRVTLAASEYVCGELAVTPLFLALLSSQDDLITACDKEIKSERWIGLRRGFPSAGVRRVWASLWQMTDGATAELMQRFYQHLLGEKKRMPAAALRAAQREMIRNQHWHAHYYWAAFTLQREG